MSEPLTIRRPDDFHLHLRDGAMLRAVAEASRDFARATVMPNLLPPVVDAAMASDYAARIRAALPDGAAFEPLMTLYLTDETTPRTIDDAAGPCVALKLYPANATTNSASGVTNVEALTSVFERMAERGLLLLIHGEVTDEEVDIFDREAVFIERVLDPLRRRVPELKIVLEHLSTKTAVDYVMSADTALAATITAHHLVIDRNHLLVGGIRPHRYCLPIVKRADDREALLAAATSGDKRFFFGSDSAPHADPNKLCDCGAAGCFTAPVALPILAHVFAASGALHRLEDFVASHGAAFYGLPPNEGTLRLEPVDVAGLSPSGRLPPIATPEGAVAVFDPGFTPSWRVVRDAAEGASR